MRRVLVLLVPALIALVGASLAVVPTAQAADPLTGRLVDSTGAHPAVSGATVRLRTVTGSGPGTIVDTDTTNASGVFSLDAGASPDDEYYVQVVAGNYQGGYVGDVPKYVQATAANASTYGAHVALGKILANPAFIRGVIVNSATKNGVAGVRVTARSDNDPSQVEGGDTTANARGEFVIKGLECEDDCYLKVTGAAQGFETGFRACNAKVVATFGDACASPIGRIGKVFLDHL